ncbi:MAG TPA: hypothetical protein VK776_14140 [Bryobacteraceae bacterium]|nr:hypothetical protein [Bryobacteraceae bacterium]
MRILLDHNTPAPLHARRLSLLVLNTNDWTRIRHSTALIVAALASIGIGEYVELEIPAQ